MPLAGRGFHTGDAESTATPVIVNRSFAREFVGDGNVVGRRIRYTRVQSNHPLPEDEETWYEIVGLVTDFPGYPLELSSSPTATVYHVTSANALHQAVLSLRVRSDVDAASFAGRLREISTEVDPMIEVRRIQPLDLYYRDQRFSTILVGGASALAMLSVLLLAGAGIYALMSFSVARRAREIGIRLALGSHPLGILRSVFARALRQLAIGVVLGLIPGYGLIAISNFSLGEGVALLIVTATVILVVGLVGAFGPAWRGLRVQPTQALRAE